MAKVKQSIIRIAKAKNNKAKYKLTYKTSTSLAVKNDNLSYSSSKTTNLTYKGI